MVVIHQSQCGDPLNLTLYFSLNGDNNAQNLHHRLIVCVCAFYVLTAHVRCCSNEAGTTGYNIRISTAVPDLKNIIILFFRREKRFCEVFFLDKAEQLFHSYPFKESEAVNYLLQFWCCIWVNAHLSPRPPLYRKHLRRLSLNSFRGLYSFSGASGRFKTLLWSCEQKTNLVFKTLKTSKQL